MNCRQETEEIMITYSNQIDVKEYNEMRGAVGWKMLDLEQAQRGLDNSEYVIAAYDLSLIHI